MHPVIGRFGKSVVIVDGGMGTLLQANGLMGGELPELWNLTHPEVLLKIQSDYVNAGCDILTANMFGANRLKLEKTGHTVQEVGLTGVEACTQGERRQGGGGARHRPLRQAFEAVR